MISPSLAEPLCDVTAQLRALIDPRHPKDAVWLAYGTPAPDRVDEAAAVHKPEGVLFTTAPIKARYFDLHPSDDALADVLGYVEPKWRVSGMAIVVRATDDDGCVITEMVCSMHNIARAMLRLTSHGTVSVLTIPEVLRRRVELCRGLA